MKHGIARVVAMMATTELWSESRAQREESRHRLATFIDADQALAAAHYRLDAQLLELYRPGQSAAKLIELWSLFGDDWFLVPAPPGGFSSADYVRAQASIIALQ